MASLLFVLISLLLCHNTEAVYAGTISMPLDHFNASDTRTFLNRYWMNDTFYQLGGPIFLFDGGEAGSSDGQAARLLTNDGVLFATLELARRFNGIAIVWEHRFYGGSMPFAFNETTGVAFSGYDAYKYLNNEQALEDAVFFAKNFQIPEHAGSLSSDEIPWVWLGGSYAGSRAAMIRSRNPDIFLASWASSAPVQPQLDNYVWWNPIQQSLPTNCAADVHAAVTYADQILSSGSAADVSLLKKAVFLTNSANPRNTSYPSSFQDLTYFDVASILAYVFQASFFNFQTFGYEISMSTFCNTLEAWNPASFPGFTIDSTVSDLSNNTDDAPSTEAGVAATYGAEKAFYAYLFATIDKSKRDYQMFPMNPRDPLDNASWVWQLCTQFAQFQVAPPPSDTTIVSQFYNLTGTYAQFCHALFPYAPPEPDISPIQKYGGWRMQPSNVMWTNGELDPWRGMSVQSTTRYNPDAPDRPTTQEIPPCGAPPEGDAVFGAVWPGQVHVSDLSRGAGNVTGPVDDGIELFSRALEVWLRCFRPCVR